MDDYEAAIAETRFYICRECGHRYEHRIDEFSTCAEPEWECCGVEMVEMELKPVKYTNR